jgi:hypothetical protein
LAEAVINARATEVLIAPRNQRRLGRLVVEFGKCIRRAIDILGFPQDVGAPRAPGYRFILEKIVSAVNDGCPAVRDIATQSQ